LLTFSFVDPVPTWTLLAELASSRHSQKEESGFTHANNVEPVTFRPHENFGGEFSGHVTWRPTGRSIMKKDFNPPKYMKVSQFLRVH
jgi:hypothetical protein